MKYLIIDDEIYARKALAKRIQGIMSDYDVEIYEAENVPTAKIILQKLHFDIIFLDPPYHKGLESEALRFLAFSDLIHEDTVLITEAALDTEFKEDEIPGLTMTRVKEYKTNKHVFFKKS